MVADGRKSVTKSNAFALSLSLSLSVQLHPACGSLYTPNEKQLFYVRKESFLFPKILFLLFHSSSSTFVKTFGASTASQPAWQCIYVCIRARNSSLLIRSIILPYIVLFWAMYVRRFFLSCILHRTRLSPGNPAAEKPQLIKLMDSRKGKSTLPLTNNGTLIKVGKQCNIIPQMTFCGSFCACPFCADDICSLIKSQYGTFSDSHTQGKEAL